MSLLNNIRKINSLLQRTAGQSVNFNDMAKVLSEVINSNIFILSRKGKILGYSIPLLMENEQIKQMIQERQFPTDYNEKIMKIRETQTDFTADVNEIFKDGKTTIVPVNGAGERLGTLVLNRINQNFNEDDLVLGEVSSTVVGMEILKERAQEIEQEVRSKASVQMAMSSLSYTELEAVEHIMNELNGKEGLLVASKVADRFGITRSVIVNALRKLESANVIQSRSLGMKGTHIKVTNDKLFDQLQNLKN